MSGRVAISGNGGFGLGHHFHHAYHFERVDSVLAGEVKAAAAQFFGEDRPRHDERGDKVGGDAGEQKWQDGGERMREFQARRALR